MLGGTIYFLLINLAPLGYAKERMCNCYPTAYLTRYFNLHFVNSAVHSTKNCFACPYIRSTGQTYFSIIPKLQKTLYSNGNRQNFKSALGLDKSHILDRYNIEF
jgi:hypothetical protein